MTLIATRFGRDTTADEVVAGADLTGIRAVVTGASSGIGAETARALARAGAEVTLAVRDTAAGKRVAESITSTPGSKKLRVARLELAEPETIATFVDSWEGPLHLLINNAGIMAGPLRRTPGGLELQFATNHLGHFALALGLHDALADGAADAGPLGGSRIVALSSSGHLFSPVVFDDIQFDRRPYDEWAAYRQSKTANVLFAVEATRLWESDGIVANAVMPGRITTGLQKHLTQETTDGFKRMAEAGEIFIKTAPQGAATTLVAAIRPEFARTGGHYLEDCNEVPVVANDVEVAGGAVRQWAVDPETARLLWAVSVGLLDQFEAEPA